MKVRTIAFLGVLGMGFSSAVAMAIPGGAPEPQGHWVADPPLDPSQQDLSHFAAGQTLTIDGRLGHASLARGGAGETFLFASVTGADAPSLAAPPLNLAIVIDRSGSMKGDRIANAIDAAVGIVERMRDGDSVAVVSFDTASQVVVSPTRTTASSRPSIESAIRSIRLGGDTCISCGLETAMSELANTSLGGDRVNRMILLSDGEANHGIRDLPGFRAMASRMRDRGCSITTIGVDVDFDQKTMAAIAAESNGRHYFVSNASGLPAIFEQEFDSLLATVARDGELRVDMAPGVEVEQVFDRSFRREGTSRIVVPFGTFSAKQEKTVLMKLRVPSDRAGVQPVAAMKLAFRDLVQRTDGACAGDLALLVTSEAKAQRDLDPFVAARLARSQTADTLTTANALFEKGDVAEAQGLLAKHAVTLRASESRARATASSEPFSKPSKKSADAFDRDFSEQLAAVATAEANFAPPPPSRSAGPFAGGANAPAAAAPEADRRGKAQVRTNQQSASDMGF